MLQIHQEGAEVSRMKEIRDRIDELQPADIQSVETLVDESRKRLEAKREWEQESGQAFVNSQEAQELLKILSGKKVPYNAKDIFIGQGFIRIK